MILFLLYHTPIFYLIQSIWRDEAFSYFMALPSITAVIQNTAHDFNPPFYYLVLHFWILIVGKSDIGLRFLSFLPHLGSTYIAYLFARKLFSKRFAWFVSLFTLFNPMLLYYAFEMRMYSYYAFFTFCSIYFLYEKKWRLYFVSTVFGLYTHSFFSLIILSICIYYKIILHSDRKIIWRIIKPLLLFIPWAPVVIDQFLRSKESWLFPVDFLLVKSVLANIFTSYEGTPGGLWSATAFLSFFIITFLILGLRSNKKRALYFIIPILLPLCVILGYSLFRRPLFVNRYMIFITVFEIFGISMGVWSIKNRFIRNITAVFWFIFIIFINLYLTPFHKKNDFKTTFMEINKLSGKNDYVYTKTPISFLESAYYYSSPQKVSVYNPNNVAIPNYIGTTVVFPHASQTTFPPAPSRIFLISDDTSFEIIINR